MQFRNESESDASWIDVEQAFHRLHVQQPSAGPVGTSQQEGTDEAKPCTTSSVALSCAEDALQPAPSCSPIHTNGDDTGTINDLDVYRVFLGRCLDAESTFKVFCLLSSPGLKDTSWVRCLFFSMTAHVGGTDPLLNTVYFSRPSCGQLDRNNTLCRIIYQSPCM